MLVDFLKPYLLKMIDPKLKQLRVSIYNQMIVHTRGLKPDNLLRISRPNEPDEIIKYRLDTYEAISRDPILRALNSTYHLVKQSDYKVICGDKTRDYLSVATFESVISTNRLNIYDLIFKSFLQIGIEDPNGLIFIKPVHPTDKTKTPNDLLPTERVSLEIEYVSSEMVQYFDNNVLQYEIGETEIDKTIAKIFMVVNDTDIYTNMPIRKNEKGQIEYELQPYYHHGFGFVPYRVLGGIETIKELDEKNDHLGRKRKEKYKVYDSFFTAYNSWANKGIIAASNTDAVIIRYGFPIVEMLDSVCKECRGKGTFLSTSCQSNTCGHNGDCPNITCSKCKGSGTVVDFSPYSVIKKPRPKAIDGEVNNDFPSVKYYTPPFEAIQANKDYWYEMMDKAEQCLAIYQSMNAQSGVAKEYDLEQKRDFIAVIGDNLMNLLEFSIHCIAMYISDDAPVRVQKPQRYEIRNTNSILAEISTVSAISKDLSKSLMLEYIDREYDGNEKRVMQLLLINDIYYGWTLDEISKLKAMQLLDMDAWDFHTQGYRLISKIISKNPRLTDEQIIEKVNAEIISTIAE